MKIFDQLKNEHEELKELLSRGESCQPGERKRVLEKIEKNLVPHGRGEEKTLYAKLLEKAKESDQKAEKVLTNEAYEEHRVAEGVLKELKSMDARDQKWDGLFRVFKENIEHHIEEEEEDLFAAAKELLSENELDQIYNVYRRVKEEYAENLPTQGQIDERTAHPNL